jgi:hypothetical protein
MTVVVYINDGEGESDEEMMDEETPSDMEDEELADDSI